MLRAQRTHCWMCQSSVGLTTKADRWRRVSRFLIILSPFASGTCVVSSVKAVACGVNASMTFGELKTR